MKTLEELKADLGAARKRVATLMAAKSADPAKIAELEKAVEDAEAIKTEIKALELVNDQGAEDEAAFNTKISEAVKKEIGELKAAPPTSKPGGLKTRQPNDSIDDDNDGMIGFRSWLKTGRLGDVDRSLWVNPEEFTGGVKANVNPLNEIDDAQGAVLVPQVLYNQIVPKRDEASIVRQAIGIAGGQVLTTSRDNLNVVAENGKATYFVITAEEASVDEDEPTFTNVNIPVYSFTKLMKVGVDVIADDASNLDAYLSAGVARALAKTENKYTITGTGSGQPQGVMAGGTAGLALASSTAIAAAEPVTLMHKLPAGYFEGAAWLARLTTIGSIRTLGTTTFRWYERTPAGEKQGNPGTGVEGVMEGKSVLISDEVAAIGTGAKSLLFGNWGLYGFVERSGLMVQRLVELYAATRQLGLLWTTRFGGAVLQAEAFQYATHNTT